ncbi:DMT family transporter [Acidaminobacter sp. JC074]|uniref:DMT family transporter n=1 Tax=Acidaminobacter sp. JC074 TaxID=2530199 RepID=UPI001F0E736C|nr:DMT family transporter [Acidaminobacter sp. JC074]MCH4889802.1 DMT family transporter [Acidaminobacter sp. JC074]
MTGKGRYYLLMILATFLFAGAFVAGKLGTATFSPVVMTFLRIGLAVLILFPIMAYKEASIKIKKEDLKLVFILGLVGMTFYHLFFFSALKYTTASNASVINGSMPIITAIIASFVLKEKLTIRQSLYIITAFIGVLTIITNWQFSVLFNMDMNRGDLLMLCGTISWATYGVIIKKSNTSMSALKMTTYTLLMCVIILLPFAIREMIVYDSLNVPFRDYYSIIYMAVFPTVMGYTIQQASIKALGPSTASLFINLVPFFSIILSMLILKEAINPLNIISGVVIIVSVILFARSKASV